MSGFRLILYKDLKSMIRDPKILIAMLIVPLIITAVMYAAMISFSREATREALKAGGTVIVVDEDEDYWSRNFTRYIRLIGFRVVPANNLWDAYKLCTQYKALGVIIIPKDFSANISDGHVGRINTVVCVSSISLISLTSSGKIFNIINSYERNITAILLAERGLNPKFAVEPIINNVNVIIRNKTISVKSLDQVLGPLFLTNMFIPIIVLILASITIQFSATSIAVEKEEKMLETLLSLPMNRFSFIAAKILSSAIVGFLGVTIYGAIMLWYFLSLPSAVETEGNTYSIIGVITSIYDYQSMAIMFVSVIGVILFVLGLGVLLALFVEDVRSAQIISSYVVMPMLIMIFIGIFIDVSRLSSMYRLILSLVPIANVGLLPIFIFINDSLSTITSCISMILYSLIVMYVDSKIINSEKVFTLRLFAKRWRRLRHT